MKTAQVIISHKGPFSNMTTAPYCYSQTTRNISLQQEEAISGEGMNRSKKADASISLEREKI